MNPIVTLPGLVQIRPQYDPDPDTGNHPQNILWFLQRAPTTLSAANLKTIGDTFDPLWAAIWAPGGASNKHYVGSITTDFSSNTGLNYDSRGVPTPFVGSASGVTPPNVSLLISLHTAERYRGGHARVYLPWIGSGAVTTSDASLVVTGTASTVLTKYLLLEPGMNAIAVGGGLTQRVYRHRTNPATATLFPLQTVSVSPMFATQRRRLRKAPHH